MIPKGLCLSESLVRRFGAGLSWDWSGGGGWLGECAGVVGHWEMLRGGGEYVTLRDREEA